MEEEAAQRPSGARGVSVKQSLREIDVTAKRGRIGDQPRRLSRGADYFGKKLRSVGDLWRTWTVVGKEEGDPRGLFRSQSGDLEQAQHDLPSYSKTKRGKAKLSFPLESLEGTGALEEDLEDLDLTAWGLSALRPQRQVEWTRHRTGERMQWRVPGNITFMELLQKLNLNNIKKLNLQNVLKISSKSLKECTPHSSADLPWHFLRKVLALDVTARDTRLEPQASDGEENEAHTEVLNIHEPPGNVSVNPLDVLCALLLSSDSFLQQEILLKMSMCQFALPLLLPPLETPQCTLMLWAMRDIVRKWRPPSLVESKGFIEESLVLTSMPTFSFVRMGRCSLSKSKLLNDFLSSSQQHCDFFIHRDMEYGNISRQISDGLVEIAWHFPGGQENSFPEPFAVANLRGDVESYGVQFIFLTKVSSAVFIFTESFSGREYNFLSSWMEPSTQYYFILESSSTTFKETRHVLNQLISGRKNSHILVKSENKKEFMKTLQSTVRRITNSYPKGMSVSEMTAVARELVIHVDEDCCECQVALRCAEQITRFIVDVGKYKNMILKLQGDLWKHVAKTERKLFQMESQGTSNWEKYKSDLKGNLLDLRQQQNKCKLNDASFTFMDGIQYLKWTEKHYFLKWMKFKLDCISRKNLSELQEEYKKKQKALGVGSQKVAERDQQKYSSSLGVQHFMRELGQHYEAECSVVQEGKVSETQRKFACIPSIAADLMLEGFPLELFDGDAFNIPLQWTTDILIELNNKVNGRSKVMVITVLGAQSTEKSTLLSTMFGLWFAESSGQTTQGALMVLLRVAEDMTEELGCDFILVIDTAVSSLDDDQHDDDLATLVIGLSDITLVNMENPTEVNILQLVTHAFLRMHITGQKPSCRFVYQNVSDVSAHSWKGKHLLEQLDGMTKAAAESENTGRSIRFSDITDFDPAMHSWYIPDLWLGAPPMAPVNIEYSKKVFELKKSLFESIKSNKKPRKDIPQFGEWVKTLWNAIRRKSSSFSFQSSLKAEAHHQLSVQYSEWDWTFRREVYLWVSEQETAIQNVLPAELDLGALERELQKKLAFGEQQILESLKQYLDSKLSSLYLEAKHRGDFVRAAHSLKCELARYSSNKLQNAIQVKKPLHKFDSLQPGSEGKGDWLIKECMQGDLPETIKFEVIWNSQRSRNTYKLSFTGAGSFSCCHTNLRFDAKAAVTVTYQLDSWQKYKNECKQGQLKAAGPLFSIQADPVEAVAAVYFPHFLDLGDKNSSQVQVAHLVEGGIGLEKPDSVEPFYAILKNPSCSLCGVVFKKRFFKQKVKVHAMALLYQVLGVSNPKFHLYLLPNDISLRKAVDEYEEKCPSLRVHKSSVINMPLTIGSSFIVANLDNVTVSPKELQLKYRDTEMEQQYIELYVENIQDLLELHVMEKVKDELVWEAYVRQEELKDLGVSLMREYQENPWENDMCSLCHQEENLPENNMSQVLCNTQESHQTYRLCSTGADTLHCCITKLRFEVKSTVTITYDCESWHKYQQSLSAHQLIAAGPLLNIHADPVEAVTTVYFPHFLYLAGKYSPQVYIAHFVEEEMSLEKPDSVGPSHVVWINPRFSPCGVVLQKSFFKRKIKVHSVALLYQVPGTTAPKFHLYLLPNDGSVRKAVHDYERTCQSQRMLKPPGTLKPLTLGSHFFVERLKNLTISPKELEFRYLDAEMEQQYLELYAEHMPDRLELNLMEKKKRELVWEAYVRREELVQFPESQQRQGASGCEKIKDPVSETHPSVPVGPHFIELHREQLIQRSSTVEGILDTLHGTVLNDEQYQKISSKETNHEKMRELYKLVPSWNLSCKDMLYKALQMKNPHLIQELGGV